ncbi:MAG: hypothetical protein LUM44_22970 [Pyrinomonadaceae bacterium]|nr:hypothetical protein [Pyrinomonadaceae bacterium]
MKVCPKCNSSYSDETLNFCLADGSPLVAAGATAGEFSNSWHDSETLRDQRVHNTDNAHNTIPIAPVTTFSLSQAKTETFQNPSESSGKKLYAVLAGIVLLLLVGGIWWFYAGKNTVAVGNERNGNNSTSQSPRVIVQLTPEQDAQVKKEITDFIESWRKTNEDRDIDKHIDHYANTLEYFYKESDINRNKVRASRQQAYETFATMTLQVDKLKISPESETSAVAVFDKSWTFKNDKKTTTGSVQQELRISKQNGKWQIVGEKDLNVYFINNRLNEENTNNG